MASNEINCWTVSRRYDNGEDPVIVGVFNNYDKLETWMDLQDEDDFYTINGFILNRPFAEDYDADEDE